MFGQYSWQSHGNHILFYMQSGSLVCEKKRECIKNETDWNREARAAVKEINRNDTQ